MHNIELGHRLFYIFTKLLIDASTVSHEISFIQSQHATVIFKHKIIATLLIVFLLSNRVFCCVANFNRLVGL